MLPPKAWDGVVSEHASSSALLVASHDVGELSGFTAVHPAEGKLRLLFCPSARSRSRRRRRANRSRARLPCARQARAALLSTLAQMPGRQVLAAERAKAQGLLTEIKRWRGVPCSICGRF
jgi:hypothetical protein